MATPLEMTKGYLFNLIIYAQEEDRLDYFHQKMNELIETFPCRAIFISKENEKADRFALKGKAGPIHISSQCLEKVPYLVLPHLIPDLPVYLLWGEDPVQQSAQASSVLEGLQRIATRLIFDPETTDDLQTFSQLIEKKIATLPIELMDLDWAKIGGWRDVIYQTFSSPQKLEQLKECCSLTIKYNLRKDLSSRHPAIQAIYLQGWLAAQLNWTFRSIDPNALALPKTNPSDCLCIIYETQGRPIQVQLVAQQRPTLPQGQIFEVEFVDGIKTTMTLAEKQSKVMVYLSDATQCELPFSLHIPNLQKGTHLMKELFYFLPTNHYRNMLSMISLIKWSGY